MEQIPAFSLEMISTVTTAKYLSLITLSVFLYDILLTLPDEVKLMWNTRGKNVRNLYFLSRYGAAPFLVMMNITYAFLSPLHRPNKLVFFYITLAGNIGQFICSASGDWIMYLRATSLFSNQKRVRIPLLILLLTVWTVTFGLCVMTWYELGRGVYHPTHQRFNTIDEDDVMKNICWSKGASFYLVLLPAPTGLFDVTVLILTAVQALRLRSASKDHGKVGIMFTFWRDGVVYFLLVAASRVSSLLAYFSDAFRIPACRYFLGGTFQWAIAATLLARLVLNLRAAGSSNGPSNDPFSTTYREIGTRQEIELGLAKNPSGKFDLGS